ncbi:hypothetical protein GUJ93_ZPchr0012g21484 [Zizania palustris]|uniref:Uncharacterized protein n=1 Tax=Zizania palustris TaxID=103762 RepID=A0A8J5WUX3_ZIZPA|nr:hypothetical protein GUJ93_ZPchr0012g21484 [Zizania palustris]
MVLTQQIGWKSGSVPAAPEVASGYDGGQRLGRQSALDLEAGWGGMTLEPGGRAGRAAVSRRRRPTGGAWSCAAGDGSREGRGGPTLKPRGGAGQLYGGGRR